MSDLPVEPPQALYAQIDFVMEDLRIPSDAGTLGAKRTLTDTVIGAFMMGARMESGTHHQPCEACKWYGEPRGRKISACPKRMWQAINCVTEAIEREDLMRRVLPGLPECDVCHGRGYLTEHQQVEKLKAQVREIEARLSNTVTERDRALDEIADLEGQLTDAQYDQGRRESLREHRDGLLLVIRDHDRGIADWQEVMDRVGIVQWDADDLGNADVAGAALWKPAYDLGSRARDWVDEDGAVHEVEPDG